MTVEHPSLNYRPDIDGLRAIAVLAVIIHHAFPQHLPSGFIGVDIFFVISGFLITSLICKQQTGHRFSLLNFYQRRIKRLIPPLLPVLVFCLLYGQQNLFPNEMQELSLHIAAATSFTSNILLFTEAGYFDTVSLSKPLLHLWSLGIEEQFYLCWPLLLIFFFAKQPRLLLTTSILLCLCSFAIAIYWQPDHTSKAFYLPVSRFWELLFGASLALLNKQLHGKSAQLTNIIASILLLAALISISPTSIYPGWITLLPVLATGLLLICEPASFLNRHLLRRRPMIFIGRISYSLYLWHWPLLSFQYTLSGTQHIHWFWVSTNLATAFALAFLSFKFIEQPCRKTAKPIITIILMALLLLLGAIGLSNHRYQWLPLPQLELTSSDDGYSKYYIKISRDADYLPSLRSQRNKLIRANYCNHQQAPENRNHKTGDCMQLQEGKRNVIVIGDSYADDSYAALSIAYPDINFLQFTGCSFHQLNADCEERLLHAQHLTESPLIEAVIFANRWRNDFISAHRFIDPILKKNKRVIVFGLGPEFTRDAYLLAADRQKNVSPQQVVIEFIDKEMLKTALDVQEHFENENISFINRLEAFCQQLEPIDCPLVNDSGEPYILDNGHLLPAGMHHFANYLITKNLFD